MSNQYELKTLSEIKLMKPKLYAVIMLNDDYTPMDFVVDVLTGIFHKSRDEAVGMMLKVHNMGQAVVGVYTFDIAMTKKCRTDQLSKEQGFPFEVRIDEAME